jgi:hypothetical protein
MKIGGLSGVKSKEIFDKHEHEHEHEVKTKEKEPKKECSGESSHKHHCAEQCSHKPSPCNHSHQHSCNHNPPQQQQSCNQGQHGHTCSNAQLNGALNGGGCQSKCLEAIQKFLQPLGLAGAQGPALAGAQGPAQASGGFSNLTQSLVPAVSQSLGMQPTATQGAGSHSQAAGGPAPEPSQNIMNMVIGNNNTIANAQAA